jgi:hypothetical protein
MKKKRQAAQSPTFSLAFSSPGFRLCQRENIAYSTLAQLHDCAFQPARRDNKARGKTGGGRGEKGHWK